MLKKKILFFIFYIYNNFMVLDILVLVEESIMNLVDNKFFLLFIDVKYKIFKIMIKLDKELGKICFIFYLFIDNKSKF